MSQARVERRLAKKKAKKAADLRKINIQAELARHPCGECKACCTSLGVKELDKAEGVACPNLDDAGCSTYDIRPQSCKDFNCLWKFGLLADEDRPDKIGVVFDLTASGSKYGRQCLVARECREGALKEIEHILMQLATEGHLIILHDMTAKRRLMGPEHLVKEAQEFLRRELPVLP